MTTLKQLIDQLCPDGVEYVRLGDVAPYANSRVSAASLDNSTFVGVDNLLKDMGGKVNSEYGANTKMVAGFTKGDVLVGNIRPYLKKIWIADVDGGCSGDVLAFHPTEIQPRFLFHILCTERFWSFNIQNSKGAKMPRGDKKILPEFPIPLPPREVQDKIVEYLDAFAALCENIDTEIAQREQQFAEYREKLLSAAYLTKRYCPDGVEYVRLGDVAIIARGAKQPQKMGEAEITLYSLPSFDVGEPEIILPSEVKSSKIVLSKPSLLVPKLNPRIPRIWHVDNSSQNTYCSPEFFPVQNLDETLSLKYLYYFMLGAIGALADAVSGGSNSHKRLQREQYLELAIPLPPREVQDELVAKLDAMKSLIDNLRLERKQRQQQFDFYREKLLAFAPKGTSEV